VKLYHFLGLPLSIGILALAYDMWSLKGVLLMVLCAVWTIVGAHSMKYGG
jgi:hypothetical protein